jgi:hypothetical protein
MPRSQCAQDGQRDGAVGGGLQRICRPQSEAIHSRLREPGDRRVGDEIIGQHAAQRLGKWNDFRRQWLQHIENNLGSFVNGEHRYRQSNRHWPERQVS